MKWRPRVAAASFFAVLALLALPLASLGAQPSCCIASTFSGLYLGLGLNHTSVSNANIQRSASGSGYNLIVGGRMIGPLSFDVTINGLHDHPDTKPTRDIYYPADSAEYSSLLYGLKFDLFDLAEAGWTPWAKVGQAFAFLQWDTFWYNLAGTGFFLAAGIDKEFSPGWILRGGVSVFHADVEDDYGHSSTGLDDTTFSLSIVYEFGRYSPEKEKPRSPAASQILEQ